MKKPPVNKRCETIAELCKAIAHPARIQIIEFLLEKQAITKTCCCGEIVNCLPLAQATVSQHLKILTETHVLNVKEEGLKRCYCLNPKTLGPLTAWLKQLN
ncbi:MAG: winged helix-turn-helix transcriptional regulator [Gammaproteobacteria bacterium]|nr:winged helix-turn-helix transcriptional regulator [Gammaproteobacteria bacterium]